MTTSGTITSSLTASGMIAAAMKELGVLSDGENPTGEETVDGLRVLNWMLKSWAANGTNLFRQTQGTLTFPANTATVTLAPFALDVLEARLVQSSTFTKPLQRWELGQYQVLPNKAQPGYPAIYYLGKTISGVTMSVWPVPQASMTVLYTYSRVPEDVTDGAQTLDLPQEWTETAYYGLASRLAGIFGATRIDPATVQRIEARAQMLERMMLDQDRPSSVFLGAATGTRYF